MLIFHNLTNAEAVSIIPQQFERNAWLWPSQNAMEAAFENRMEGADVFPWVLTGPIITVERDDGDTIDEEQLLVDQIALLVGGEFAGT